MAEVLFISEEKLKSYAIAGNVSSEHLLAHLKDAQRIYIERYYIWYSYWSI